MEDLKSKLTELNTHIANLLERLTSRAKKNAAAELEQQSAQSDSGTITVAAQQAMRELTALKDETTTWPRTRTTCARRGGLTPISRWKESHTEIAGRSRA